MKSLSKFLLVEINQCLSLKETMELSGVCKRLQNIIRCKNANWGLKFPNPFMRKENHDYYPLRAMCLSNNFNLDVIRVFLESGIKSDKCPNSNMKTPLMYACEVGSIEVVKLFLEKTWGKNRANVNATDIRGETPLFYASEKSQLDVVKFLLEKGANVNATNNIGETPLFTTCYCSYNLEILECLIEHDAKVDVIDDNGHTPLIAACQRFCSKISEMTVEVLLKTYSENIDHKDKRGKTALVHASTVEGNDEINIVETLLKYGADMDIQDEYGETALMKSIECNNIIIVETLLKYGANMELKDNEGDDIIDFVHNETCEIVKFIQNTKFARRKRILEIIDISEDKDDIYLCKNTSCVRIGICNEKTFCTSCFKHFCSDHFVHLH